MKKRTILPPNRLMLTIGLLLMGLIFAHAQTFIGTTGNQLWSDPNNWLDGLMPSNDFSAVTISADVIVDEDVSIGMLYNSGNYSLTVKEGKKLTSNASIAWGDENDFILEDKAQLVCRSPIKVKIKKKIHAYDEDTHAWGLIASPVEDDIVPSIENGFLTDPETGYALFSFDEATAQWTNFKESPFVIENGKGYLYANALDTTLVFEGKTVGAIAGYGLSYHASNGALAGCNIMGNPLPCNAFIDRSYYIFSEESNSVIAVAFSMNRPVAPCTGVIVQSEGIDDYSVWFDNGVSEQPENHGYIEITATKSNAPTLALDQAIISFNTGDDLAKYHFFENSPHVYFSQGSHDLAIISIDSTDMQPLRFKAEKDGSYTLHFELRDLDLDYLQLIDNLTGARQDLLANPNYTFNALTSDYASRFKLVFDPHYSIDENGIEPFAYVSNESIIINDVETQEVASLQIIDLTGRVIVNSEAKQSISTKGIAPGVYVLRLNTPNAVRTQRVVID